VTNALSQGKDEYQCRITVEIESETTNQIVAGTLISNRPRVINVRGISQLDAMLQLPGITDLRYLHFPEPGA